MQGRPLHIAWLSTFSATESGGGPGVAIELLCGLARRGHRIDCFAPGAEHPLPARLRDQTGLQFIWGTSAWQWGRWYSRTRIAAFASGLILRGLASVRLRRQIVRVHHRDPYDLIFQISNIETLARPRAIARSVPLVMRPDTHAAGELRFLIAERRLALRSQRWHTFAFVVVIMSVRSLVQRVRIRHSQLVICISQLFRENLVRDYGLTRERVVVVRNPVRLERFTSVDRPLGRPPVVLFVGRIAVRKGIHDVVEVARLLLDRGVDVRMRVVGGPGIWSDYTRLLSDLPANAEYVGRIPPAGIPGALATADVLLQASHYEPFGLTVAEALAAGVPVVATTAVGAIEGVDRAVAAAVEPGDVDAMTDAILAQFERLGRDHAAVRKAARAEAERLFAPDVVCERIDAALQRLVADGADRRARELSASHSS